MAAVDFPRELLRGPLVSSLRRTITPGFVQSSAQSGTPYNRRVSFDNPVIFDLAFVLDGGKRTLFDSWIYTKLDGGIKPFNIELQTEGGFYVQEAWFTPDGVPQATSQLSNDVWRYEAQIRLRQLVNPWREQYDTLEYFAQNSPNNDAQLGMELLDISINENLP